MGTILLKKGKIFIVVLSYLFVFDNITFSQELILPDVDVCSQELQLKSRKLEELQGKNYQKFIEGYIRQNYQTLYTFNLHSVDKLTCSVVLDSFLVFEHDKKEILFQIQLSRRKIKMDVDKIDSDDYLIYDSILEDSLGYNYYGNVGKNKIADFSYIKRVTFYKNKEEFELSDNDELKKLLNPNIFYKYYGLEPITAFYDKKTDLIYIFIFGIPLFNGENEVFEYGSSGRSYLAKVIIDYHSSKILDIQIIHGGYLSAYGWLICKKNNQNWYF